jgi:proteic killer suppression protein
MTCLRILSGARKSFRGVVVASVIGPNRGPRARDGAIADSGRCRQHAQAGEHRRLSPEHADGAEIQLARLSSSDNIKTMIESFGNRLAEDLFYDRPSKEVRQFPPELRRAARRKLLYVHDAAELMDLRTPPGNRLEAKKGKLAGYYAIRINDQWRILFRWEGGNAKDVQVTDYH